MQEAENAIFGDAGATAQREKEARPWQGKPACAAGTPPRRRSCARGVAMAKRRGAAAGQPRAAAPLRAKEKAPPMSGTPYPPTDFLRSTFGEEGLNFRVRNGIG